MVLFSFFISAVSFLLGVLGIVTFWPAIINILFEFFNGLF